MQVKIIDLKREDKIGKNSGRAFVSLRLKTDQHDGKWISGFGGDENSHWQAGDTVDIEVEQKGEYLNFKTKKVNVVKELSDSRAGNLIDFKVLPTLDRILARQGLIMKALDIKTDETGYPIHSEKNDAHAFDEVDTSVSPF